VQRRTIVSSAVTLVAAFVLSGCGADRAAPSPSRMQPATVAAPAVAPLPATDTLAGVLYRLADPSVPPEQKTGLLQYGSVDDEPALTNFGQALAANGYAPLTVAATDVAWAPQPGNVTATVTLTGSDPALRPFTYPMEFTPLRDGWQITRRSAEQLLPLLRPAGQPAPPG
jgi:hypothetical protein